MEESIFKRLGNSALTGFKTLRVYPIDACVYLALCSADEELRPRRVAHLAQVLSD